jgi:endonuclease/exonuclease/phosphatase family metal-dependent hydrolase
MRVLSYNILTGGTQRIEQLKRLIKSQQPDIVGLIEATDEQVIQNLASGLGMDYRLSGRTKDVEGAQGAILSRLPVLYTKMHTSKIITKQPLLEVGLEVPGSAPLTVFLAHLTADFSRGWAANRKRRHEVREFLRIMEGRRGMPHLIMGDFNALAPGERLKGSLFLQYVTDTRLYDQLKANPSIRRPDLGFVLPPALHVLKPLLARVPGNKMLAALIDRMDIIYAPRGGIEQFRKSGYVDCFRALNPQEAGCTWPAPLPSGRVDFIFASPELARSLTISAVITEGGGVPACQASDHLPVMVEFALPARIDTPRVKEEVSFK